MPPTTLINSVAGNANGSSLPARWPCGRRCWYATSRSRHSTLSVRAQILNLLVALQSRHGMSTLFVSHDLAVVRHVCDRVAVMYLGRLAELAPRDALYAQPRHPYTKALLAAVPEPDPAVQRAKPRVPLTGEIPSAANPPSGCRFHTRCQIAIDICRHEVPAWRPVGNSQVACHLV